MIDLSLRNYLWNKFYFTIRKESKEKNNIDLI